MDPEVGSDLLQRHPGSATSSDSHDVLTELSRKRSRHNDILSAHPPRQARSDVTSPCSRPLDCTFAEFDVALANAEVIEEHQIGPAELKELVLVIDWVRPLHVVVVVDDAHEEERIVTVYEPDPEQWSSDYRRRR
jgi:hypothetical protein